MQGLGGQAGYVQWNVIDSTRATLRGGSFELIMTKEQKSYELLKIFLEKNFYVDSSGELQYKWVQDTVPVYSDEMVEFFKEQNWEFEL